MKIINFIKEEKVFTAIILLSLISSLRSLITPPFGDELTYLKLADNILKGKYYLINNPSTVTPIIPLIIAFFKINAYPMLGFALAKIFHIILTIFGFRYLYLFLAKQQLNHRIIVAIIALTAVNPIAISNFGSLYPEAILFFCFWGVIYYSVSEYKINNLVKMLFLFLMLSMTRYLYLVLGLIVVFNFYKFYKSNSLQHTYKLLMYTAILMTPILFWAKYVYSIEQNNLSEISYFNRFKTDNQLLYNIKSGLGIIKHHEVSRINGIPAFISLFIPITGFRHYLLSIILLLTISFGYFRKNNSIGVKILISALSLTMLGLIFAGTGFSRYWLILLPGFFLGFYYSAKQMGIKNKVFIYTSQIVCFIYIVNELRLDLLIINKHL
ncbi:hypothetical protein ES677_11200 [Bizionia gelidisalsuginis]|uniref:Glycosyltransferase RgtA/B/C/D-like domain-containing protein n=1 Tax=Bizionia gelidisalsuginis TaxID=291188 RepID=A0ABY3M8Q7_9FLAO|nr:hypothetical protein [Bizionia gelidisalsuginis]TYC10631.1 hypothetical protein ES677_11200 [Bizionia gelidisalsuginis]